MSDRVMGLIGQTSSGAGRREPQTMNKGKRLPDLPAQVGEHGAREIFAPFVGVW